MENQDHGESESSVEKQESEGPPRPEMHQGFHPRPLTWALTSPGRVACLGTSADRNTSCTLRCRRQPGPPVARPCTALSLYSRECTSESTVALPVRKAIIIPPNPLLRLNLNKNALRLFTPRTSESPFLCNRVFSAWCESMSILARRIEKEFGSWIFHR